LSIEISELKEKDIDNQLELDKFIQQLGIERAKIRE
jgi:hypothetical protein